MMRKAGGSGIVRGRIKEIEVSGNRKWRRCLQADSTSHIGRNRILYAAGAVAALFVAAAAGMAGNMTVDAAGTGEPVSRGVIQCEQAVIDADDFRSIYSYMTEQRNTAAGILLQLGTKFRQESGEIVCDRNPDAGQGELDLSLLSWPVITQAVADSQKVPGGLTVMNPEAAMHIEGVEEYTDYYATAVEDNISRGKAAWADGRLLLGNGADNDRAYQAGIRDGESGHVPENLYPLFSAPESTVEIRHAHVGSPQNVEGVSGCYRNFTETHTIYKTCGATLRQTESTWYPNPDEPEGGSWHGGEYTCPTHGGLYHSPGTCPEQENVSTTVWRHDITCGLTDVVYARLTVGGTDTDYTDRTIRLKAVLEGAGGYERLVWQDENELIWTDENGNTLGTGTELDVQAPGTYQCRINVSNQDIDKRTAAAAVRISGLMLRN